MSDPTPARGGTDAVRATVRAKYGQVAKAPRGHFPYPVGRESALRLGYRREHVAAVPDEIVERFVGVGNPFRIVEPRRGDDVLDVGCGCGLDAFVAATCVGPSGRVVGIDLTVAMLEVARRGASSWEGLAPEFLEASVEALPFPDASFDLVVSNGVLNLVPDKDRAFGEIARVLRPGGRLAAADLLVIETVPAEVLADPDAWAT